MKDQYGDLIKCYAVAPDYVHCVGAISLKVIVTNLEYMEEVTTVESNRALALYFRD